MQHPSDTPPPTRVETREERLERRRRERAEQTAYKLEQEIALWDPTTNPRSTADPFKTLFVARVVCISSSALLVLVVHSFSFYVPSGGHVVHAMVSRKASSSLKPVQACPGVLGVPRRVLLSSSAHISLGLLVLGYVCILAMFPSS